MENQHTYITRPKRNLSGYRKIKEYPDYTLFERVVGDKVLYRECFNNFELYGAVWAVKRPEFKELDVQRRYHW